jgi:hypothetical protein
MGGSVYITSASGGTNPCGGMAPGCRVITPGGGIKAPRHIVIVLSCLSRLTRGSPMPFCHTHQRFGCVNVKISCGHNRPPFAWCCGFLVAPPRAMAPRLRIAAPSTFESNAHRHAARPVRLGSRTNKIKPRSTPKRCGARYIQCASPLWARSLFWLMLHSAITRIAVIQCSDI